MVTATYHTPLKMSHAAAAGGVLAVSALAAAVVAGRSWANHVSIATRQRLEKRPSTYVAKTATFQLLHHNCAMILSVLFPERYTCYEPISGAQLPLYCRRIEASKEVALAKDAEQTIHDMISERKPSQCNLEAWLGRGTGPGHDVEVIVAVVGRWAQQHLTLVFKANKTELCSVGITAAGHGHWQPLIHLLGGSLPYGITSPDSALKSRSSKYVKVLDVFTMTARQCETALENLRKF